MNLAMAEILIDVSLKGCTTKLMTKILTIFMNLLIVPL